MTNFTFNIYLLFICWNQKYDIPHFVILSVKVFSWTSDDVDIMSSFWSSTVVQLMELVSIVINNINNY